MYTSVLIFVLHIGLMNQFKCLKKWFPSLLFKVACRNSVCRHCVRSPCCYNKMKAVLQSQWIETEQTYENNIFILWFDTSASIIRSMNDFEWIFWDCFIAKSLQKRNDFILFNLAFDLFSGKKTERVEIMLWKSKNFAAFR